MPRVMVRLDVTYQTKGVMCSAVHHFPDKGPDFPVCRSMIEDYKRLKQATIDVLVYDLPSKKVKAVNHFIPNSRN